MHYRSYAARTTKDMKDTKDAKSTKDGKKCGNWTKVRSMGWVCNPVPQFGYGHFIGKVLPR
jgi:hypothetical protein